MKAYTDIEQSKKLADILPIESADMWYCPYPNEVDWYGEPRIGKAELLLNQLPCWSLAALLSVLPSVIKRNEKTMFLTLEKAGAYNLYYKSNDRLDELWETDFEPIDACYKMILCLHELKLL